MSFNEPIYEAIIYFETKEVDPEKGEISGPKSLWHERVKANTLQDCLKRIAYLVNAKSYSDLYFDNSNNDKNSTKLWYSTLIDRYSSPASKRDIDLWQKGKLKLWKLNCNILLTKVDDKELVKFGLKKLK